MFLDVGERVRGRTAAVTGVGGSVGGGGGGTF